MILVDSSVWIDHLRSRSAPLAAALERGDVLTHPFVNGEIACGNIRHRSAVLALLSTVPAAVMATDAEVLVFIQRHRLIGKGIGYIDAHLLASVTLTDGALLWTRDKALGRLAEALQVSV